jgi:hypothetical protein
MSEPKYKNLDKYEDSQSNFAKKKDLINHRAAIGIAISASSLIETYKINYLDNTEFLIRYSGLNVKKYSQKLKSLGFRSYKSVKWGLDKKTTLGFDLMHFAGLATVFRLPISFLINFNFNEYDLDVLIEKLVDFKCYQNCFAPDRKPKSAKKDPFAISKTDTVRKAMVRKNARKKGNNPKLMVNVYNIISR